MIFRKLVATAFFYDGDNLRAGTNPTVHTGGKSESGPPLVDNDPPAPTEPITPRVSLKPAKLYPALARLIA